jgi:hypothetical protein
MLSLEDYVINTLGYRDIIKQWLDSNYKKKPLVIYGNPGSLKTTIANYILKDWVKVRVNIENSKKNINLEEYLELSLYKKSITMMFSNDTYKSLILDDLSHIQSCDKKLLQNILLFSKKKITDHPVIYIFDNVNNKNYKSLLNNSIVIHIDLSIKVLNYIVKTYLLTSYKLSNKTINDLIIKSHCNINSVIINIDFYKNNFSSINEYDKNENELSSYIRKIIQLNNTEYTYNSSFSDYNIIGLNILENCYDWFTNLDDYNKVNLIKRIYGLICQGDMLLNKMHYLGDWSIINHIISNIVYAPIVLLNKFDIKPLEIDYNKFISRSIIYTYNIKLLNISQINIDKLSFIYKNIEIYYLEKDPRMYDDIINYIKKNKIPIKLLEKFQKYFTEIYELKHKKNLKIFYNH